MDFHRLSRKELQTLCKKNKIPANMTNVAMADALEALQLVEGLDEFLNPVESDYTEQIPDKKVVGTPQIHRTACRTSTRRKPVRVEPETTKVSTRLRRGTRAGNVEGDDQENKDLNVPATPAMPSSRTRASAISTLRKKESHMKEGENIEKIDVPKTPAAPLSSRIRGADRSVSSKLETTGGAAVQCTRRSMRLLEKSLADMSLMDTEDTELEKNDEISKAVTNVSQQNQDSAKTEMGTNLQTSSAVDSETSDDVKATSQEKNNGCECQQQESESEVQLGSEAGAGSEHVPNSELKVYSETYNDPIEVLECREESEVEFSNPTEKEVKLNDESVDEGAGVSFEVENSIDSSNPENKFCSAAIQDLPVGTTDDASPCVTEQEIAESLAVSSPNIDSVGPEGLLENSTVFSNPENTFCSDAMQDVPVGATCDASLDVTEQEITGSLAVSSPDIDSVIPEGLVESSTDFSNPENMFCSDAPVGATDDASRDVTEQEIAGSLAVSSSDIDSVSPEGLVLFNTDNQDEENEHWNLVDGEEMLPPDGSPAKLDSKVEPETSDSLSDLGKYKEVMEKLFVVSENSVSDLRQGDIEVNSENLEARGESHGNPAKLEVRVEPHLVVSEKMEANGEPETSDYLSDSLEPREVMEKIFVVPENPVANLQPEEIALPKLEFHPSTHENEYEIMKQSGEDSLNTVDEATLSTTTLSSNCERKNSDVPTQSIPVNQPKDMFPCVAQSESEETATANEVQTAQNTNIQDDDKHKILKMKENMSTPILNAKSMGQLKRMFKMLSLDARKGNNGAKHEVERKRTALQALPENRMAGSETENNA